MSKMDDIHKALESALQSERKRLLECGFDRVEIYDAGKNTRLFEGRDSSGCVAANLEAYIFAY